MSEITIQDRNVIYRDRYMISIFLITIFFIGILLSIGVNYLVYVIDEKVDVILTILVYPFGITTVYLGWKLRIEIIDSKFYDIREEKVVWHLIHVVNIHKMFYSKTFPGYLYAMISVTPWHISNFIFAVVYDKGLTIAGIAIIVIFPGLAILLIVILTLTIKDMVDYRQLSLPSVTM